MAEITAIGPKKTIFILATVAGCFAMLWPRVFYPMLAATVNPHHSSDAACCDVIFDSDVTAADIMYEICQNILKHHTVDPRVRDAVRNSKLTPQSASLCRQEVLTRCAVDVSLFLAERERLGKSYMQVLEEVRTFNSSLCLKTNFGVPLSQLGTPHLIRYHILMPHSTLRQERRTPPHAGGLHPALRERGRAIPSSHIVPKVSDRPDHVMPKMRPPLGGAGHVPQTTKGNGTMGIVLPIYTIGIVLFFLYTIVRVCKTNSENEIISEYPGAAAEREFQRMVFNPETFATALAGDSLLRHRKDVSPYDNRPIPTIEELKDLNGAPKSKRLAGVDRSFKVDAAVQDKDSIATDEDLETLEQSPTAKVLGMEMTASYEGGQNPSRPTTPIIPAPPSPVEREKTPPKPIYLEGALPSQCELMVTDSETQAQQVEEDEEAPVVLSGKMTLSLISLDQNPAESEEEHEKREHVDDHERETEESAEEEILEDGTGKDCCKEDSSRLQDTGLTNKTSMELVDPVKIESDDANGGTTDWMELGEASDEDKEEDDKGETLSNNEEGATESND